MQFNVNYYYDSTRLLQLIHTNKVRLLRIAQLQTFSASRFFVGFVLLNLLLSCAVFIGPLSF
jgi:hypothetical protein